VSKTNKLAAPILQCKHGFLRSDCPRCFKDETAALRAEVERLRVDAERWNAYQDGKADPVAILNAQMLRASTDALRFRAEAEARADRYRKALEEIASLPCDCGAKGKLKPGHHFHDCVVNSDAVDIATNALSGEEEK
jgi:hypothetical protein